MPTALPPTQGPGQGAPPVLVGGVDPDVIFLKSVANYFNSVDVYGRHLADNISTIQAAAGPTPLTSVTAAIQNLQALEDAIYPYPNAPLISSQLALQAAADLQLLLAGTQVAVTKDINSLNSIQSLAQAIALAPGYFDVGAIGAAVPTTPALTAAYTNITALLSVSYLSTITPNMIVTSAPLIATRMASISNTIAASPPVLVPPGGLPVTGGTPVYPGPVTKPPVSKAPPPPTSNTTEIILVGLAFAVGVGALYMAQRNHQHSMRRAAR